MAEKEQIGKITHFFDKVGVAVLEVSSPVKVGDKIHIEASEPFDQEIASMQVEHKAIEEAKPGDDVGLKVDKPVKKGDLVYKA